MSDLQTTSRDGVHLAPGTREAATRYLTRKGYADLLPILGLAEDPEVAKRRPAVGNCPVCGNKLASHGGCNRRPACREWTHGPRGEAS